MTVAFAKAQEREERDTAYRPSVFRNPFQRGYHIGRAHIWGEVAIRLRRESKQAVAKDGRVHQRGSQPEVRRAGKQTSTSRSTRSRRQRGGTR